MDAMAAIKKTFFEECEEQLAEMEAGLLAMNEGSAENELVNGVFRAVHSIKGGAGAFKLGALVSFAHKFETVLDLIRSARLSATPDTMRIMLRALDIVSDLVRLSRAEAPIDDALWRPVGAELEALIEQKPQQQIQPEITVVPEAPAEVVDLGFDFAPTPISIDDGAVASPPDPQQTYEIEFRPSKELYASANEPVVLLREVAKLGETSVRCNCDALPPLDSLDPDSSYLSWTIRLVTAADIEAVREVFEFVDGACELSVALIEHAPAQVMPAVAVPVADPSPSLTVVPDITRQLHEARADSAPVLASESVAAADIQKDGGMASGQPATATIRVDLDRVDRLINLVGELVINQAMLTQRVLAEGLAKSSSTMIGLDELEQLTREIQESVMAIRAQPIKSLFQRMSRVMREVCAATGKDVRLRLDGEMTELDKTVIERLADPLTHMIRNAVDHGVESRETRIAAGKSPDGSVRLSAAHRSGRVQIEISDDGAGIDRKRVLAKAISKGLVLQGVELSDGEIDNLFFLPGFSTSESVSAISGRGVGMDVVRRSIQALGGRISISSRSGQGSSFVLSLPLTLAVLDGMVVRVADQTLVVPLTAIIETLRPASATVHALGGSASVIKVRDRFVPLIDVGAELGFRARRQLADEADGVAILVESETSTTHALLVDTIEDQRQVVIKSVETNYGKIRGIAAATILGDGRVALIVDVEDVVGISRSDTGQQINELRTGAGIR